MEDALDLVADVEEVAEMMGAELDQQIEFFYNPGLMSCPIDGCNPDLKFYSKGKWQRHWEEKHMQSSVKFICSVKGCGTTCKRRADMRAHIKMRHERDVDRAEEVLNKCEKTVMENKGFINPGFFTYKGRTKRETPATTTQDTPACMDISAPIVQDPAELQEVETSSLVQDVNVDDRIVCVTASQEEVATQTTCLDYSSTSLDIPPPPDTATDLQHHIMWLCNLMDQAGRARELAKRKLEQLREESSSLEQERKRRRELEAKNRELKRQLKEMEWRSTLFPGFDE